MDNNTTRLSNLLEDDEFFKFAKEDSLCTACELELENESFTKAAIKQEKSVHFEDNSYAQPLDNFESCQQLQKATRSLSRISLDRNDSQPTVIINDQATHQGGVDRALNILHKDLEDSNVNKNKTVISPKDTPSTSTNVDSSKNKSLCDKETQTDSANEPSKPDDLWADNDFLPEELERIDKIVNKLMNEDADKNNKRKYDNTGTENNKKRMKTGARGMNKAEFEAVMSAILKREQKCLDCSNDLFEYSEYLHEIKNILMRKRSSSPVKIPHPPRLVGYDYQFEFQNDKRYPRLPIQKTIIDPMTKITNWDGIKRTSNAVNFNPIVHPEETVTSNQRPMQTNRLTVPKNLNVASKNKLNYELCFPPKNTLRQSTIKEAFALDKINYIKAVNRKQMNNINSNAKVNVNHNQNNTKNVKKEATGDSAKDNTIDTSSMYYYNPLRLKNNVRK